MWYDDHERFIQNCTPRPFFWNNLHSKTVYNHFCSCERVNDIRNTRVALNPFLGPQSRLWEKNCLEFEWSVCLSSKQDCSPRWGFLSAVRGRYALCNVLISEAAWAKGTDFSYIHLIRRLPSGLPVVHGSLAHPPLLWYFPILIIV